MKYPAAAHAMALLVLAYSLWAIFGGEVLSVNGGFGWDGMSYAAIAKDFPGQVFGRRLDPFRIQRIVPSGAVYYGLRLAGLSTNDDSHILRGFQVYNMLLLLAGVYAWNGIAARLGLTRRGTWLGFAAVYVNFAVLRMTFFYPVLTDTTALVAGMFLLHGHLAGRAWVVWLVGLGGAFTWPLLLPMALVLLVFPRRTATTAAVASATRPNLRACLAGGTAVALVALWRVFAVGQTIDGAGPLWYAWTPAAAACVAAYLGVAAWRLLDLDGLARPGRVLAQVRWQGAAAALGLMAAVMLLRAFVFVPNGAPEFTAKHFLCETLVKSVAKPGIFLVAHVVYFGPVVLAAVLFWPEVCERIRRQGIGVVLLAGAAAFLSVGSESRQFVNFLPLVAAFTVQTLDERPRPHWHDGVFLAAALVLSKCWLPLNHGPTTGNLERFPDQFYFMNHGPWMSDGMYLVQGAVVAALAAVLVWMGGGITKARKNESTKGEEKTPLADDAFYGQRRGVEVHEQPNV